MRLISLDELIFGELIEFQMQAGPLFARIRSRAYMFAEVSRQQRGGEGKKDKPSRAGGRGPASQTMANPRFAIRDDSPR